MNHSTFSMPTTIHEGQRGEREVRLRGHGLVVARLVWVVVAVFTLNVFIVSPPVVFADLEGLCTTSVSACVSRQLSPEQARTLQQAFGLSLHGYAILSLAILMITSSV